MTRIALENLLRDGYYDKNGHWKRTKFCFMYCGDDRCTCRPPNGIYFNPQKEAQSMNEQATTKFQLGDTVINPTTGFAGTVEAVGIWQGKTDSVVCRAENGQLHTFDESELEFRK